MIISVNTGKTFDKIQYTFMMKILNKLTVEGNFLNMRKAMYKTAQLASS